MRVLIDTNVFISSLLSPHNAGAVQTILQAWAEEKFTLLIPEALLDEILVTVSGKARLAKRIALDDLVVFLTTLQELGAEVPRIESPIPAVTRDPKDDYLLAYVLVGRADYLVTGDVGLLVLEGQIPELTILTSRQFSKVLSNHSA